MKCCCKVMKVRSGYSLLSPVIGLPLLHYSPGALLLFHLRSQKNGTITGVYIESRKGNICRLENPWPGTDLSVVRMDKNGKTVKHKTEERNVISFKTGAGDTYLIIPKGKGNTLKQTVYESSPNQAPKTFFEAALGKVRNF